MIYKRRRTNKCRSPKKNANERPFRWLIEYGTVFINQFSADKERQELEFLEIENTQASILGYIACSKSKLGLSIINEINEIMSQKNIQQHIIDSHKEAFFNPQEQEIIAKELHKKFQQ